MLEPDKRLVLRNPIARLESGSADINTILTTNFRKEDIRKLYRLCDYYYGFTILGTAIDKMAEFPLANIYIVAKTRQTRDKVSRMLGKIRLMEKLKCSNVNLMRHGISVVSVMQPSSKMITCKHCDHSYLLEDLIDSDGNPQYRYDDGKFYFNCNHPDCTHKGESEFASSDKRSGQADKLRLINREVYYITILENEITGDREYYYQIPPGTKSLIKKKNHFALCTTPDIFLKAADSATAKKVKLDTARTFVFEMGPAKIDGMPIPPMARSVMTMLRRGKFDRANMKIADDMMIPMRMLFTVDRAGNNRVPNQNSGMLNLAQNATKLREEINKWLADNSYMPIVPMEVGSKDFWGDGKMLVLDPLLTSTTKDALAEIGVAIEFIYGGATWSRQNVSAIVLENTIWNMAMRTQELLDYISEQIQESIGKDEEIGIYIKPPRIVEGLSEMSFLKAGMDDGDITKHTYYGRMGIDYDAENEMGDEELEGIKENIIEKAKMQVEAEIAASEMKLEFGKKQADVQRREQLKDQLALAAVKADDMASSIKLQKEMLYENARVQKMLTDDQFEKQKSVMDENELRELRMMKANIANNIKMMREQMHVQTDSMKQQALAEREVQKELQSLDQQEQEDQYIQMANQGLTEEDQQAMASMSEEEQRGYLINLGMKVEMDQFYENLPDEEKESLSQMPEEEKYQQLQSMMSAAQEEESLNQPTDEKSQDKMIEKKTEEEDIYQIAMAIRNATTPEEVEKLKYELMQEDATKYSKVMNLLQELEVQYQTEGIMKAKPGDEMSLITMVRDKMPEIADKVTQRVREQLILMHQAKLYAGQLYRLKDKPDKQAEALEAIAENAPDFFKAQIVSFYKAMLEDEVTEYYLSRGIAKKREKLAQYYDLAMQEMAAKLKGMPEEDRKQYLEMLKQEDTEAYNKVLAIIGG